jgi:hypothetical protein
VRDVGATIDIEFSASSAEPSLVELRSTGQPRAAVPTCRLWRVLPVELLSRVPHPSSAWVGILTVESMAPIFFECHTRNASRVPLIQAPVSRGFVARH